jgi:hypothetical protein
MLPVQLQGMVNMNQDSFTFIVTSWFNYQVDLQPEHKY